MKKQFLKRKRLPIPRFTKADAIDILYILAGMFIFSIAVNIFIVNAQLLSGGLTGASLILQYLFRIPIWLTTLLLNIPLIVLSICKLDFKFTLYSSIGIAANSLFIWLTADLAQFIQLDDPLVLGVLGGVFKGVGIGLTMLHNGSSGGLDILALYLRRHRGKGNIGTYSFVLNIVIILCGMVCFGINSGLYTAVSLFVTSFATDYFISVMDRKKMFLIVSDQSELLKKEITVQFQTGVTIIHGEGAYTGAPKEILYCIVYNREFPELRSFIKRVDPNAFISIIETTEVWGSSFKNML
ncbi:MAG: YitT family protein [Clostridiales bacterium]|jgi:uncharacterized membrane-anchored protein YitT (DUF2179 family)|nr:YitT family protein [Clostridiales bacterium]